MADKVFPGSSLNRPLLPHYLKARLAAACDGALALTREKAQAPDGSAVDDLVEQFDVMPIELGEPEAVEPRRVSRRTGDPRRGKPWDRDPEVPHDRYCVRRSIVTGGSDLLRQWPNTAGLHDVSLTSYDDDFVYVTWDVPVGDDPSIWASMAREQMDRLDTVLRASRAVIEEWRPELDGAVNAAVDRRLATFSAADHAHSSLGAIAAPPDDDAGSPEPDDS